MRTNLEKWNHYHSIIEERTNSFIEKEKEKYFIPDKYYVVYFTGEIGERNVIGVEYSHFRHGVSVFFKGKKPTKKEVESLKEYSERDIPFSDDYIFFKYSEIFNKEKNLKSVSNISLKNLVYEKDLFHSYEDAESSSKEKKEKFRLDQEFDKKYKKDKNFNYKKEGYKFLGWQNGWEHDYYDEDGNLCKESGKPTKSFGYSRDKHKEYRDCIDSKHRRIEVNTNRFGSENIVSCPLCKIYWKYDSSD